MNLAEKYSLPRYLADFRDYHKGETILVCGCGRSLNEIKAPERFITIGVNDVGRLFDPTYLVVLNPRHQFKNDRFRYVEESRAKAIFTQLDLGIRHPHIVRFKLGKRGGTVFSDPNVLHFTLNSPYVALCLAVHMGANRIGLVGVDFTDHHFFGRTGRHALTGELAKIDQEYARLNDACEKLGVDIVNLSHHSRLTAFRKRSIDEFFALPKANLATRQETQSLRIISYATTPLAGVPAILARCINACTPHISHCVWAKNNYGNGVVFQGDIEWTQSPTQAKEVLAMADVVIVHNGKVAPEHHSLISGKSIVTMAHNYLWNVDQTFVKQGFPGVVVGQYQAALPDFKDWHVVPNPIPLQEELFQPGEKADMITICYTPSGKHEHYPQGHRLYWHAKGYATTMQILDQLAARFPIRLEVIRNQQVSHVQALAMKQRAHIVIDECVTGSYHRNSLEGLATGCVVVNGMGLLPAIVQVFHRCIDSATPSPFVYASLKTLQDVLTQLIDDGVPSLTKQGRQNRGWMEKYWKFERQWEQFWKPVIARAIEHRGMAHFSFGRKNRSTATTGMVKTLSGVDRDETKKGVSIIIPHGGEERLSYLAATLINLQQCQDAREIIVVEIGSSPCAEDLSRRYAHKYVFVKNPGAFERARALNVGIAFAEYDVLLWLDNDLLVPPDFIGRAEAELRNRQLDYMLPYTAVHYLAEADSKEIMAGVWHFADCTPIKILEGGLQVSGGAGLVQKAFVLRYGGFQEGFRGWGGEDNAWSHKARLLGNAGVTQRRDQPVFHLYHAHSGGNSDGMSVAHNPHYAENVNLLHYIRRIRTRHQYLKQFPPPRHLSCPWDKNKRIVFLTEEDHSFLSTLSTRVSDMLAKWYGVDIDRIRMDAFERMWFAQNQQTSAEQLPDAIVLFGTSASIRFLANTTFSSLFGRALIVDDMYGEITAADIDRFRKARAILTLHNDTRQALNHAGLLSQVWDGHVLQSNDPVRASLALAQPLSVVVADARCLAATNVKEGVTTNQKDRPFALPVWLYWEGDCPEWIKACQCTIFAHAPDVRLLTPANFKKLRDRDLDIDLSKLCVAHRADYIRAFLLAKFGGLWIDSDCLVMRSLLPILEKVGQTDFLAHKERSGYISNGFIGARPGSRIADLYYRRICKILRSRRPLGWTSLGSQPLTEILHSASGQWQQIECELIQPICWSNPDVFFAVKEETEHGRIFNDHAICYMLFNKAIQRYTKTNPNHHRLMADGTFFRYLLSKAMKTEEPDATIQNMKRNAKPWLQIPFCIETLVEINPTRVLDTDVGLGRWGFFVREFCESPGTVANSEKWKIYLEGIVSSGNALYDYRGLYDKVRIGEASDLLLEMSDIWNLIIFGKSLASLPVEAKEKILEKSLDLADYVLVDQSLPYCHRHHHFGKPTNKGRQSSCTLASFFSLNAVRFFVDEHCLEPDHGTFLLSRSDPKHLRQSSPMEVVFSRLVHDNVRVGSESVSGPGSSLVQTKEIRQRLPHLIANLNVRSLLDAPCGDFHWMRHVALGPLDYTGVDIIRQLVEENQQRFGTCNRKFIIKDITKDPLPSSDLILCRDCLVHFPFQEIFRILKNFKRSNATYLLMTTFSGKRTNKEIAIGDWRPLNFQLPPFNFPEPLRLINEKCTEAGGAYTDKSLGLWKLSDLSIA